MLATKVGRLGLRTLTGYAQQSQAVFNASLPAVATAQQSCWMSAAAALPAPVEGE